jgi:hypothetical protein
MHHGFASISLILVASAVASAADIDAGQAGNISIHGFASQGALKSSDNNYLSPDSKRGTANFNEFGLAVSDHVNDQLSVGMQLFARSLGDEGKDTVTLDWAYGDYRWKDWLGIRAGKIHTPLGLYNESRDIDLLRTDILLPQILIYNEGYRDVLTSFSGAEIYGNVDAMKIGSIDYEIFGGSTQIPADSSLTDKLTDSGFFSVTSYDIKDIWGGQATWSTPLTGLRVGGSYYKTDWAFTGSANLPTPIGVIAVPDYSDNTTTIEVGSAEYTWHDLTLAGEIEHTNSQLVNRLSFINRTVSKENGYYVMAGYRFCRYFAAAASFACSHTDSTNSITAAELLYQKDTALSARFDIDPHWLVKLEGHYMVGDQGLLQANNPSEVNGAGQFQPAQHWWVAAAKTTFSF